MNWQEAELLLDKSPTLIALPINGRRTAKSYLSGYQSSSGRHLALERRGTAGVAKVFFEEPFEPEGLGLTLESGIKHYGASEKRLDIGRASTKLSVGNSIVCVKVASAVDLNKLIAAASGA